MMSDDKKTAADKTVSDQPVDDSKADQKVSDAGSTDQYGRQLFEVTCAGCGKPAQVPFKPSGDRPVYCRDCYMQQRRERRGGGGGGGGFRRDGGR